MDKMVKGKLNKFRTWFVKNRIVTFVIDFLFLSAVCCAFVMEHFQLLSPCIVHNVSIDIVISLVPAVITIISISIQAQNDKIRGISTRDFNKTRTGFYYSLTHMLLVFVGIFAVEAILLLFNLRIMLLFLDGVSLAYSTIFLIQEMPILTKSDKRIDKELQKYPFDKIGLNQERQDVRFDMLVNTVMDIGIIDAFIRWRKKNGKNDNDLLLSLLSISTIYYSRVIANLNEKDSKETIKYYDVDIIKAIDNSFCDLEYLLDRRNEFNINIIPDADNGVFFLTRLTYLLHDVCKRLNYSKKFSIKLQDLIDRLYLFLYQQNFDSNKTIYQYLLVMSVFTLKEGECWFIKCIRDISLPPYFFNINENPLTFLLSMYMCFILRSKYASEETKNAITSFLDEQSTGPNSGGYRWREKLESSLHHDNDGKDFFEGWVKLIKIKHLYDNVTFDIGPKYGGIYTVDDSTSFSDELVFDYCLQILLYNHYFNVTADDVESFINSLSKESLMCFRSTFQLRWKRENGMVNNNLTFYKFAVINGCDFKYFNENIYNNIDSLISKINRDEYYKNTSNFLNDNDLLSIKSILDEEVPRIFKEIQFFDSNLDSKKTKERYFGILLEGPEYKQLLSSYLKHLKYSIYNFVKETIVDIKKPIILSDGIYDKQTVKEIIDFKPKYNSDSYRLYYNADDEQRIEISKFIRITNGMLPRDMYLKNEAIKIQIDYYKDESLPRRLNRKEIEEIIDKDYPMINGYYRFNKYKGGSFGDFLVTRDELINLLSNKYIFVPIVFAINVVVNDEDILFYSFNEL